MKPGFHRWQPGLALQRNVLRVEGEGLGFRGGRGHHASYCSCSALSTLHWCRTRRHQTPGRPPGHSSGVKRKAARQRHRSGECGGRCLLQMLMNQADLPGWEPQSPRAGEAGSRGGLGGGKAQPQNVAWPCGVSTRPRGDREPRGPRPGGIARCWGGRRKRYERKLL